MAPKHRLGIGSQDTCPRKNQKCAGIVEDAGAADATKPSLKRRPGRPRRNVPVGDESTQRLGAGGLYPSYQSETRGRRGSGRPEEEAVGAPKATTFSGFEDEISSTLPAPLPALVQRRPGRPRKVETKELQLLAKRPPAIRSKLKLNKSITTSLSVEGSTMRSTSSTHGLFHSRSQSQMKRKPGDLKEAPGDSASGPTERGHGFDRSRQRKKLPPDPIAFNLPPNNPFMGVIAKYGAGCEDSTQDALREADAGAALVRDEKTGRTVQELSDIFDWEVEEKCVDNGHVASLPLQYCDGKSFFGRSSNKSAAEHGEASDDEDDEEDDGPRADSASQDGEFDEDISGAESSIQIETGSKDSYNSDADDALGSQDELTVNPPSRYRQMRDTQISEPPQKRRRTDSEPSVRIDFKPDRLRSKVDSLAELTSMVPSLLSKGQADTVFRRLDRHLGTAKDGAVAPVLISQTNNIQQIFVDNSVNKMQTSIANSPSGTIFSGVTFNNCTFMLPETGSVSHIRDTAQATAKSLSFSSLDLGPGPHLDSRFQAKETKQENANPEMGKLANAFEYEPSTSLSMIGNNASKHDSTIVEPAKLLNPLQYQPAKTYALLGDLHCGRSEADLLATNANWRHSGSDCIVSFCFEPSDPRSESFTSNGLDQFVKKWGLNAIIFSRPVPTDSTGHFLREFVCFFWRTRGGRRVPFRFWAKQMEIAGVKFDRLWQNLNFKQMLEGNRVEKMVRMHEEAGFDRLRYDLIGDVLC